MKRMVRLPRRRSRSASAITALISLMPLSTALKGMNSQCVTRAISFASVVLPTPGGPQRMIERQLIALDLPAQRLAGAEDVLLADVIFERSGTHALGQRTLARSRRIPAARERSGVEQAHERSSVLWRRAS